MPPEMAKIEKRKKARKALKELSSNEEHVLVLHYSCESFYDIPEGRSARVTSIAVRSYSSGQTTSFSIHKVAELKHIQFTEIEGNYDDLEKEMLAEFFNFMAQHKEFRWVHWNMRDINFGFSALEHRYRVLGGEPCVLEESKKYDLARMLVDLYTNNYASHPRMTKLMEMNRISAKDFLDGKEEAASFENKEFVKLHQSTLRKVDVFCNVLGRAADRSLKTNTSWWQLNGLTLKVAGEVIAKHWIFTLFVGILGVVASVYTFFH